MTMKFDVIVGGLGAKPIVDTWCGERFVTYDDLTTHWAENPRCRTNALVSNQTQSKYGDATTKICICGHSRHEAKCHFPRCGCG